jgi:hypothetical protein
MRCSFVSFLKFSLHKKISFHLAELPLHSRLKKSGKYFFSAKENSGNFFPIYLQSQKNRFIHQIIVKDRTVSGFSDVIDLVGFIVRLAGVFRNNRTVRLVKKVFMAGLPQALMDMRYP